MSKVVSVDVLSADSLTQLAAFSLLVAISIFSASSWIDYVWLSLAQVYFCMEKNQKSSPGSKVLHLSEEGKSSEEVYAELGQSSPSSLDISEDWETSIRIPVVLEKLMPLFV